MEKLFNKTINTHIHHIPHTTYHTIMFFYLLLSSVSAAIVSLENITLPIIVVCNYDNCTISPFVPPVLPPSNNTSNDTTFSGTFTGFCNLDQDCPRLESCSLGVCGVPLLGCSVDFDCFEPDVCLHGVCSSLETCTDVCVTQDTMCIDGFCLEEPNPSTTETSTETPTETSTETSTETPTETSTETPTETSTETPTETSTDGVGYYQYMKEYLNI
jgi:hypothetical protein